MELKELVPLAWALCASRNRLDRLVVHAVDTFLIFRITGRGPSGVFVLLVVVRGWFRAIVSFLFVGFQHFFGEFALQLKWTWLTWWQGRDGARADLCAATRVSRRSHHGVAV